jgi:translocator protein
MAKKQTKKQNKINWKVLIVSLVIVYAVAFLGSLFTSNAVKSDWYQSVKPTITPPNYIFPIVWTILFFLIALSLYFAWLNSNKKQKNKTALFYGINFVLNILWSVFYFGMKNPLVAFIVILLLWVSILSLIIFSKKINKKSSYLLIPYLLWVSFAIVLNYLSL